MNMRRIFNITYDIRTGKDIFLYSVRIDANHDC